MPSLRRPHAIRKGSTIGIAAPAGPIDLERLEAGETMLRKLGFEVRRREDVAARRGYLAGDDARRAAEFMELVNDPEVDAIVCARGGYGSHRIVSMLDAEAVRRAAKPLVGYSDVTTLLLWQRRCAGLMGIHGPMLDRAASLSAESRKSLVNSLLGMGPLPRIAGKSLAGGWSEGRLSGGSLSLVVASLGTPWEIDTRGAILLLEEVGEDPYRVDRMLQQLMAAGKLSSAVGVGIGSMTGCESERYPTPSVTEVLEEILAPLELPVVTELPFGHCDPHISWPVGARAAIDGDRAEIELLEAGVSKR
ncbi:MAG: LD-carboxypeptidase [Deltaproteobacteria bacterium]|nr:LD-carboxypeptidase [Deltaproteobacteria bacterium]MBW2419093.1 LD-carboxypeptidase [Deltaproteobacteria bacterium]